MSFKLLAIRPLEGTDPKFLKNLRPNYIYKFYNEYHYLDEHGNKLDEYKDDQEFIDYSEVVNITKSETVPQNLYGENINISALVGQNGSGKSTLLELFYMCILSIANGLYVCESIYIEIYLEINSIIYKLTFEPNIQEDQTELDDFLGLKCVDIIYNGKEFVLRNEIPKSFFTNVINYSVYGLNENISGEWLGEIFRKNDAYTTPITINPYRENGNIDVNKEYLLAQQRMILNHYVIGNKNILEGYELKDIVYTIDLYKTQKIFYKKKSKEENINTMKYINNLISILYGKDKNGIEKFVNLIFKSFNIVNEKIKNIIINKIKNKKEDTLVNSASSFLNLKVLKNNIFYEDLYYLTFLYLIKKVYKISDTYENFRGYYNLMSIPLRESVNNNKSDSKNFESGKYTALEFFEIFLNELYGNQDHITFKLKQSSKYIEHQIFEKIDYHENNLNIYQDPDNEKIKIFIDSYIDNKTKIEDIPLALFDHEIIISKEKDNKTYNFTSLSSGEQQKIHTILNVVYHAYNITSKNEDERYKNMNLIFDEVELYFHPEFQRTFISDLLAALNFFDGKLNFNILFSTHSPFILSDIPSQNILKLEDGKPQPDKDGKNSFGANIHDLLADEFFLEKGFMGEFAKEYINFVYKEITELNDIDFKKYDELKSKIQIIGEPVLRNPILKLLDEKLSKHNEKNDLINYYKQLIQKLEE